MKLLILLLFMYGYSSAFIFDDNKWDSLRVTWGFNPFSSRVFASLPRNINEDAMGFVLKDNWCDGTEARGPFAGKRYWKGADPAVMLIFDVNGIIAGIQTAVPKSSWPSPPPPQRQHPFIDDGHNWVLTAYFVDPAIICNGGRTRAQLESEGTGNGLRIQNGSRPLTVSVIDLDERVIRGTDWKRGRCFITMGVHYWYKLDKDMSCDEFFPSFLLYNRGKLNAFGWSINTRLMSSRYEHPKTSQIGMFIGQVPDCFHTDPNYQKLSTMHIYFTNPYRNFC